MSPATISALANWQSALPPAVHDALQDRRMPEYRDKVQVTASLVRDWKTDRLIPIVDVTNEGDQIVSLMSLRLQIEDDENLPVRGIHGLCRHAAGHRVRVAGTAASRFPTPVQSAADPRLVAG